MTITTYELGGGSYPVSTSTERAKRIPFDPGVDFEERTLAILRWYRTASDPYRRVLLLLLDCGAADHGRAYVRQCQGATYKQLAAIAYAAGMSWEERQEWYAVCEAVGLTHRHAVHILGRLNERTEEARTEPERGHHA
jgi:hypothetical protein